MTISLRLLGMTLMTTTTTIKIIDEWRVNLKSLSIIFHRNRKIYNVDDIEIWKLNGFSFITVRKL